MLTNGWSRAITALGAAVLMVLALVQLERPRAGLDMTEMPVGTTPATLIQRPGATGPVVVVAHGFAGSRQIMQGYTLTLAQAGYRVLAFDFQGHGRNPVPMSGDVTTIDGTTALLVAETRRVIAAARALPGAPAVSVLGHSMATDVIIRAALAEGDAGAPVTAVVAVSMFSQAITATEPARLLIISGAWEGALRAEGMAAVHQIDPAATEGAEVGTGLVRRMAIVAPGVEHVGVLYSPTAIAAARDWLDAAHGHDSGGGTVAGIGPWILVLMVAIVAAFRPLSAALPQSPLPPPIPRGRFLLAVGLPAVAVPLALAWVQIDLLPVLVADYLMLHLAATGALQLAIMGRWPVEMRTAVIGAVAVALWGVGVLGLALDRYAASFWPSPERVAIIAALALGTVPFMIADARLTGAGRGGLARRIGARIGALASLALAAALNPGDLMFLFIVLPVVALFYLVHGLLGRWVAQRAGVLASGLGLGLCLAWALGVSFPLFQP